MDVQSISDILAAGLEAQDWRETASITNDWRRFGKFGRGAMYIILHRCVVPKDVKGEALIMEADQLWFGPLHKTIPEVEVIGPTLDNIFDLGAKESGVPISLRRTKVDADAALNELLNGGSK